jgi:hypothetical protein
MTALCAATGCRSIGYHLDGCHAEPECLGCVPRLAGDGLNLCWPHRDQIGKCATRVAEVYDELLLQLAPTGVGGEYTSGTKDPGINLNPRVVACRDRIATVLAAWAKLVVDERGFAPPGEDIRSVAAFIVDSATWLAAHPLAGECADELRDLAYGEPWRVAYPSGTRVVALSPCTVDSCGGEMRAIIRQPASLVPSEIACNADTAHRWPVDQWLNFAHASREAA